MQHAPNSPTGNSAPATPIRRTLHVVLGGGALFLAVFSGLLPCPTAKFFHFPCPGCGLTRASKALLAGDLHAAFNHHPLVFLILPFLVGMFGANTVHYIRTGYWGYVESRRTTTVSHYALVLLMVTLLGVWLARFFGAFGGPAVV